MNVRAAIRALRPEQWIKNAFVFVGLVFAGRAGDRPSVVLSAAAFGLFCLQASAVYLLNDVMDLESDRAHPAKKGRPIASGLLGPAAALVIAAFLTAAALSGAWMMGGAFFASVAGYAALNMLYSAALKRVAIVDALAVAGGFVLRTLAGCYAIDVMVTDWLIASAMCISLLIAFGKRRQEIPLARLGGGVPAAPGYSVAFLDMALAVTAAATVVVYILYTKDPSVEGKFGTDKLIWTNPFVIFGVLRYLYIVHNKGLGAAPASDVVMDPPLLVTVCTWALACAAVIHGWTGP